MWWKDIYRWFGRNGSRLPRNTVRGSGGVRFLGHEEVLKRCEVEVFDIDVEDILWVKLSQVNGEALTLAVCYTPPDSSAEEVEQKKPAAAETTGGEIWLIGPTHNWWRLQCKV